jgi:hypothetical protein
MTKAKSKSGKSTVKATAAKSSVRKSSIALATSTSPLIVLGFDEQQKPRGAKFVDAKLDLVTKAADLMGLKVYEASAPEVAELAKKLPLGRLYANGRGFSCPTSGKTSTATSLRLWRANPRPFSAPAATVMCCRPPVDCLPHGRRSGRGIL